MGSVDMPALNLCVIAPFLQGGYMSEIINHIRRTCATRDYSFTLIRTNSTGEYNLNLGVKDFDGVITIRNAASPKLVEYLQNRGIPVVAIAHDYFPLDVPIISSNNSMGMDLAFKYLYDKGHKRITFVGDLSQYDLRKRFERFCELLDIHKLHLTDKSLVCIDDSLFSGGREAAAKLSSLTHHVDAVICGAGHTGMGFVQQLALLGIKVPESFDVISFDDIAFMRVATPKMPRIDQNLDIVSARAVETLETLISRQSLTSHAIQVEPTLIIEGKNSDRHWDNRIHELDGLDNLNYVDSLINNSFELTNKILDSNLNKLMSLSPLFQQHMQLACLSELRKDKFNRTRLCIVKVFENTNTDNDIVTQEESLIPVESFPGKVFKEQYGQTFPTQVHFPLFKGGSIWGFITVFGDPNVSSYPTSFAAFTGYMDTITNAYSLKLDTEQNTEPKPATQIRTEDDPMQHLSPYVKWDLETGAFIWNENALERLGFITDLEKSIYRNMDIFDRLHTEDENNLRKEITLSLTNFKKMNVLVRFKIAQGGYGQFRLEGEVAQRQDERAILYRYKISQIN